MQLATAYSQHPHFRKVLELLQGSKPQHQRLSGLAGSASAMLASAVIGELHGTHLIILEDKESAAYFQNDLQDLLGKDVHFFPDSFKKAGQFLHLNNSNIYLRTESLNRFLRHETRTEILVTYPESVFENVVSRQVLAENTLELRREEAFDMEGFIEMLVEFHYERTEFVYEPGQFSIRGGIVDVYSFGHELPYRIELFGDEIDSLRTFDPSTQESVRKIDHVAVVPNTQTHFSNDQKSDLFSVLPDDCIVWTTGAHYISSVIKDLALKVHEMRGSKALAELDDNHPLHAPAEEIPFMHWDHFDQGLQRFHHVEIATPSQVETKAAPSASFSFQCAPQPAFNRQFDLLIKSLVQNTEQGIVNCILSENSRQFDRFDQIFEDLGADVAYEPIKVGLSQGFTDLDLKLACWTDHQIFSRFHKYKIKEAYSRSKAISSRMLRELSPGDYVTHIDHGVGRFSGLEKIEVNGKVQEAVRLIYQDSDLLYVSINSLHKITKYAGKDSKPPRVNKLGSDTWEKVKNRTRKKVRDLARDLILLYSKRKAQKGFEFTPDSYLQTELEASFIYEDTPDQFKATQDVKADMEAANPMDRLVCGDVGFGKTEVAIRAAFKAVSDSKQVAVLVPTTILAMQHFKTFQERLGDFPVKIDFLSRFKSAAQKKETLERVKKGEVDILIGTHALLGKTVEFKDLGLMIVDEEQKFGVAAKEKLRKLKLNVDTLTLTATPIPRTLQFSLMGARDLSVINTPPPNRQPIQTELHVYNDDVLRDAIRYEVDRGGQVFLIHNRVKDIKDVAQLIRSLCPDIKVGVAHGQMETQDLENAMNRFIEQEHDVLLATNIIEAGLDIPNANTIIINNAQNFGLSDLHQLRGRVGRSNRKAFCYLFSPPMSALSTDARKRLQTIEKFADLGSGFNIAMRDLDIRGAGNLLGAEQSGFIADIGFDAYHKILDETILELKETEFKDLFAGQLQQEDHQFVRDCTVETDLEILIPDSYVTNINERLALYTQLNAFKHEEEIAHFRQHMQDRFGPIPHQTEELFNAVRLQWFAKALGFERLLLKSNKLRCFFVENKNSAYFESPVFGKVLEYVQSHRELCMFKETAKHLILTFEHVPDMERAEQLLESLNAAVFVRAEPQAS